MADSAKLSRRRLFPFRKQGQQIVGHQTGDIVADEAVTIEEGAVLTGNVTAVQIKVAGLLYGTAVTEHLIIEPTGQLWGDAYAAQLQIKPGGIIQGWVSSSEAGDNSELQPDLPAELKLETLPSRDDVHVQAWHTLQNETGKALAAYAQLKQQFENRLDEEAGVAFAEAKSLQKQLAEAQRQIADLQKQLIAAQTSIEERDDKLTDQNKALIEADEQAASQKERFDALQGAHDTLVAAHKKLEGMKYDVDLMLVQMQQRVDVLESRNRTLETTLQTSIQRTAEQEDALLHWQELAETTQERLEDLEKEKELLGRQIDESADLTGKLREKNSRLEFEWQQTLLDLEKLQNQTSTATEEEMRMALADKQQQISTLKELLGEARQLADETDERILWHKASLRTTQESLDQSRLIASQQELLLLEMQNRLEEQETAVGKWKTAVEQMASRLQEQEKQIADLQTKSDQDKTLFQNEKADLQEIIRHKTVQVDTYEDEIKYHLKQMSEQGQRLAENQASLVEREIQFEKAAAKIKKQSAFIARMKSVTSAHIQQLEAQLAQAKQQLKKTTAR